MTLPEGWVERVKEFLYGCSSETAYELLTEVEPEPERALAEYRRAVIASVACPYCGAGPTFKCSKDREEYVPLAYVHDDRSAVYQPPLPPGAVVPRVLAADEPCPNRRWVAVWWHPNGHYWRYVQGFSAESWIYLLTESSGLPVYVLTEGGQS